jgi:hypothetical protein
MKCIFLLGIVISVFLSSCQDECDPGVPPADEILYLSILNANGSSFIKYPSNVIPDSLKVTNLSNGAVVSTSMLRDSILSIENYNKANGGVTSFKISKGTFFKPDTVQITIARKAENDKCGGSLEVARFSQIKINGVVKCNNSCVYNNIATIQR